MKEMLKQLCLLPGPSGYEYPVREYIMEKIKGFADEITVDTLGNLIVFKKGKRKSKKNLLLAAHMDEVGIIVTSYADDGYLKFDFIGGVDRRVAIGKTVLIGDRAVQGLIGLKAYHLVSKSEEKTVPKTEAMYIDIGVRSKETAEALVSLGDSGVFDVMPQDFGDNMISARAIDDRVGCALLIELIRSEIPRDCFFAFTVQEEVGTRGAATVAYALKPDIALILEGTTAADLPGVSSEKRICRVGGGVVIPFMDKGTIYDSALVKQLNGICDANGIKRQTKEYVSGGTDASAIQRSGSGVQTAGIAAPVRNIHSPSCVASWDDIECMRRLAVSFLEACP